MPWGNMRGAEILILALIILLLFGARRLPELSRSVARSLKIFRSEVKSPKDDTAATGEAGTSEPSGGADRRGPAEPAAPDHEAPAPSTDGEQKRA